MLKQKLEQFYALISSWTKRIFNRILATLHQSKVFLQQKITSWWQIAVALTFAIVFLYYPIGGWMIHDIDTSSSYHPQNENGKLSSVDMMSYLINREVHYKIWTPNLPFLFPSYFLDNMPSFQSGLISAVGKTALALDHLPLNAASETARTNLKEAAELLQYPGNVWLFSPQNHLLPAPSSNTQYKKGRKKLNNFNNEVSAARVIIDRSPQNFGLILHFIRKDINRMIAKTENHVRETNDAFTDFKADDVFYFDLGKLYAYSQILRALGVDFKNVLVKYDIYQQWTAMLKSLEEASDLNPSIVRNGKLNSSFAPNHLIAINYFGVRAANHLNNIINKLDQPMEMPK